MITNREELINVASAWLRHANADVRDAIDNFIEQQGTSVDELADVLAVNAQDLYGVLDGTRSLSLELFAKLLIATDHILEIKPIMAQRFSGQMPPMGGRMMPPSGHPMPPMGGMRQMPQGGRMMPPSGYPMPPMGDMPQTPRFGGMPGMRQRPNGSIGSKTPSNIGAVPAEMGGLPHAMPVPHSDITCGNEEPISELASMSRQELVGCIRDNGWDGEIDLACATRGGLINFINNKRRVDVTAQTPQVQETAMPLNDAQLMAFQDMIAREIQENPNLENALGAHCRR